MIRSLILASALLTLCGCVTANRKLGESFGDAVAANSRAQIVDATPAKGAPQGQGAAVDLAVGRYKADKVKKPEGDQKPGVTINLGGAPPAQ